MALTDNINHKPGVLPLGNRNDFCYLCARNLTTTDEKEYKEHMASLKGKLEGKPVVRIGRPGMEFTICLECIHKIAKEHPLSAKDGE